MRRFIVLAACIVAVLTGALSASASTSRPAPRLAPLNVTAKPARPVVQLAAEIAAMKQAAGAAVLARALAAHNAHLAHVKELAWRTAHARHLHLLHLRQLDAWAAARAAAAKVPVHTTYAAPVTEGETRGSPAPAATYSGGSGFQQCVISRESGGNSQVENGSGHYGLYQFSASTWQEYGGSASSFGNASVAQQNQVFQNAMAQGGASNWSPYDGCEDAVIRHSPSTPVTNATLIALIRPAAALDAHQLHLLHLAQLAKAHAVLTAVTSHGAAALAWAVAAGSGHPYIYGDTGPGGYDCSGLVMEAYAHTGITLPRTTEGMLGSSHLVRVYSPKPGDLAFFGTGHVELYVRAGETFGAHDAAQGIGYMPYGGSWAPSAFYSVR